jgi:transcriptional regulator with XRE-family HTH domain
MPKTPESPSRTRHRIPPMTAIRRHRLRAGLTQSALAARAQISMGWLATVEREPEFLSPPVAMRLASALGCTPADLFPSGERQQLSGQGSEPRGLCNPIARKRGKP